MNGIDWKTKNNWKWFIKFRNKIPKFKISKFCKNEDEIFIKYYTSLTSNYKKYFINFYNETNKKTFIKNTYCNCIISQPIWDNQCRCFDKNLNTHNIYGCNPNLINIIKPYVNFGGKIVNVEKNVTIEDKLIDKYQHRIYPYSDLIFMWENGKLFYKKINEKEIIGSFDFNIRENKILYYQDDYLYVFKFLSKISRINIRTLESIILPITNIKFIDSNRSIYSNYYLTKLCILHENGIMENYKLNTEILDLDLENSIADIKISGGLSIPINQDNCCDDYQLPERLEYFDYIPIYLIK